MIERTTSTDVVIAGILWAATIILFAGAGVLILLGHGHKGIFIAEVACALSAYAAVRHLRCYAIRVCAMLRRIDDQTRPRVGEAPAVPVQRIH